jgi:hypothetical protein
MVFISTGHILLAITLLAHKGCGAPTSTPVFSAVGPAGTLIVPVASEDANGQEWATDADIPAPEAIRGTTGATVIGPQNVAMDQMNPDLLAPPSTDAGNM